MATRSNKGQVLAEAIMSLLVLIVILLAAAKVTSAGQVALQKNRFQTQTQNKGERYVQKNNFENRYKHRMATK